MVAGSHAFRHRGAAYADLVNRMRLRVRDDEKIHPRSFRIYATKSLLTGGAFQAEAIENADTLSIDGNDSGFAQFA